jgi:hypothetical protein
MGYRQLRTRVAKLERQLPKPPPQDKQRKKQLRHLDRRLTQLCEKASQLMTTEEATKIHEALREWSESSQGPYANWFGELLNGRCRLPELDPAPMRDLLMAWLSPNCDSLSCVCRQCGLMYPHHRWPSSNERNSWPEDVSRVGPRPRDDVLEFFSSCPGCGASTKDFDWAHLVHESCRPWMAQDGCIKRTASVD